jgi:hypothetical protein
MRIYRYIGPSEIRDRVVSAGGGRRIRQREDLEAWVREAWQPPEPDGTTPATFVLDASGALRLSERGTEHVMCAEGADVLAAGELFLRGARVEGVTNQSTGYCPEPDSWSALRDALDALGIEHPGGFTHAFDFRRCETCGAVNLVKEDWFFCEACGAGLPAEWNVDR